MVNFKFAKFKDAPLNRDGETLDPNATLPLTEGAAVGFDTDADGNTIVVAADAEAASAQPMNGVLMEDVYARSHWSVNVHDNGTFGRQLDEAYATERTQAGDEVTYFTHGIYLEDEDETTSFTAGEPVYLDAGGGYTQSPPRNDGDIVQVVGVAVSANRFLLDVSDEYVVAGSAVKSGDATGGKTAFTVAHGLDSAPEPGEVEITPTAGDAAGDFYVATDATNVTVNYVSAPADGTDNVTFDYVIQA